MRRDVNLKCCCRRSGQAQPMIDMHMITELINVVLIKLLYSYSVRE